eukprot:11434479-Heterocapsa_arctica.AAC.1
MLLDLAQAPFGLSGRARTRSDLDLLDFPGVAALGAGPTLATLRAAVCLDMWGRLRAQKALARR